ncbi:MAG: RIP metalloprotease RseP [Gammaproteobacteria bacterium]|nr:RIP metalloprotease RseP [Gammaproteobacteria bacterium]
MIYKIILVYLSLQIIIFIHELGHFLFARYFKYIVTDINIGFGKILYAKPCNKFKLNIRLLPLGGFIRIEGLGDKDRWSNAILTYLGGIWFNLLFAFICMLIVFNIGITSPKPILVNKKNETLLIVNVNGKSVYSQIDLNNIILNAFIKNRGIEISFSNGIKKTIQTDQFEDLLNNKWLKQNGLTIWEPTITPEILNSNYPALKNNDKILTINGIRIKNNHTFKKIIEYNPNQPLKANIERNNKIKTIDLKPRGEIKYGMLTFGYLDVTLKKQSYPQGITVIQSYHLLSSIKMSCIFIIEKLSIQFIIIGKLLTGKLTLDMLTGPIGIYSALYQSINYGLVGFLYTISLLSIAIAVINLIPIPPTDGFHILIKSTETIMCAKFSKRYLILFQNLFLILIFLIIVNVTLNDIHKNLKAFQAEVKKYEVQY